MAKNVKKKIIALNDFPPDVHLRDLARIAFVLGYTLMIDAVEFVEGGKSKVMLAAKKIPADRCGAFTLKGKLCQGKPVVGTHRCKVHSG